MCHFLVWHRTWNLEYFISILPHMGMEYENSVPCQLCSLEHLLFLQDWSWWQVWSKGGGHQLLNARWWAHVKGHRNILQYPNWGDANECSGPDLAPPRENPLAHKLLLVCVVQNIALREYFTAFVLLSKLFVANVPWTLHSPRKILN